MKRVDVPVSIRRRGRALIKFIVGLIGGCVLALVLALVLLLDRTF